MIDNSKFHRTPILNNKIKGGIMLQRPFVMYDTTESFC